MAALLASNEELTEALKMYEDLERVGIEREAEARSRKETRIDRNVSFYLWCTSHPSSILAPANILRSRWASALGTTSASVRRRVFTYTVACHFSVSVTHSISDSHSREFRIYA